MLIPLDEIVRSVTTENPWWESGEIPKRFDLMARRAYFEPFQKLVSNWQVNRAIILMGPRRVGKTVMTQQLVKELILGGVNPTHILYVSIDTPTYTNQSLQFFVDLHSESQSITADAKRYVIFDEIQYLSGWEQHLKVLVDKNPHIRFIASGSAAAALKLASAESGAGRFTEFMLPPLTFEEYLIFLNKADLIGKGTNNIKDEFPDHPEIEALNDEFVNYINFGGYPEAVFSEEIRTDAARYIKNDIIDKVLLRDLPQLYGITNIQELNKLFTSLAYQTGQEVSLETLAQNSGGISKPTIARYIEYLEAAFLIFRVRRVDDNARTFSRDRTFKVYLTNPSMRAALFSPLGPESEGFGHLVETAILSQWFHSMDIQTLHYARWRRAGKAKSAYGDHGEIDLVNLDGAMRPSWVIEIKWSDSAVNKPECWNALREFVANKRSVKSGVFTSRTIYKTVTVGSIKMRVIPAAVYCYTVGRNTTRVRGQELVDGYLDINDDDIDDFLEDAEE
jgi:predicted AAA+ superfamily ATPase